jgi:hypothetical protein
MKQSNWRQILPNLGLVVTSISLRDAQLFDICSSILSCSLGLQVPHMLRKNFNSPRTFCVFEVITAVGCNAM